MGRRGRSLESGTVPSQTNLAGDWTNPPPSLPQSVFLVADQSGICPPPLPQAELLSDVDTLPVGGATPAALVGPVIS